MSASRRRLVSLLQCNESGVSGTPRILQEIRSCPSNVAEDLTITWLSQKPEKELITIVAASQGEAGMGTVLLCAERASAGKFTIPAWTLSALPPSAISNGAPLGLVGIISSPLDAESLFIVPGLDAAALQYVQARVKNVPVR